MNDQNQHAGKEPSRVPDKPRQPYLNTVMFLAPLLSALMLGMGIVNMIGADGGLIDILKIVVITIAAFVISYAVYRLAIEKGAPLASRGMTSAGIISVVSILLVGGGLWSGTFPGLAMNGVEERRLQEFISANARYVEERSLYTSRAVRAVPVIASISADLASKQECETVSSCVSGSGNGGYGQVARAMENLAARAQVITQEALAGLRQHDALLEELSGLSARQQNILADETTSIWVRRSALRQINTQVGQVLNRLEEAVPVAMLMAYADELRTGIEIPGNAAVTATINGFLNGYAANLETVLDGIGNSQAESPVFPPRSGAIETLSYIGQYAPIAILTFAIELIFPLALWAYTLLTLIWERYRDDPENTPRVSDPSDFERLTNKSIDQVTPPKSLPQYPQPRAAQQRSSNRRNGK